LAISSIASHASWIRLVFALLVLGLIAGAGVMTTPQLMPPHIGGWRADQPRTRRSRDGRNQDIVRKRSGLS
jgi:hypothetical protein